MTVTWTTLGPDTLAQWAALTNELAEVDGTGEFYSAEDLGEELAEDGVDPALDTVAVMADGRMVGFGQLRVAPGRFEGHVSAWLGGGVSPSHRGQGIGRQIQEILERRALELAAVRHPGVDVVLRSPGLLEGASVRPMLEHRGYSTARYFHDMALALPATIDVSGLPAVQPFSFELMEATRVAHNEAFAGHWGSTESTPQRWHDFLHSHTFRPELSFVSIGADGLIDAYALVKQWLPEEAYVDLVGVRPRARQRGLARACLGAAVNAASHAGLERVELSVDTENAQGAGGLYASIGFAVIRTTAAYTKLVPAPSG